MRKIIAILLFFFSFVLLAPMSGHPDDYDDIHAHDIALVGKLRTEWSAEYKNGFFLSATVDSLNLFRASNSSLPLVGTTFVPGVTDIVNSSDLNLGLAAGMEIQILGRYGNFGGDVNYFSIFEWSANKGLTSVGGAAVNFATPIGNTAFPADISVEYVSKLHNVEANFRWYPIDKLALIVGSRFMKLDEELEIIHDVGPGLNVADIDIDAENDLWGGQIGVAGEFFQYGGLSLDGWAKGGYFANNISTEGEVTQQIGPNFDADEDDRKGTFSTDFGINANYNITPSLKLSLGYHLLWIEEVATSLEQVPALDPVNGTGSVITNDVLFNGFRGGITFTW